MPKKILILIFSVFLGTSCEKKIEIHPENSEEKVFVEALYTDSPLVSYIKLSKTKGIYESITGHPPITDADVNIKDLTKDTLIHCHFDGEKYIPDVMGVPGHDYVLEIQAENQHISGTQSMTSYIPLLNINSYPSENHPDEYYLVAHFEDPPQTEDYYLFIIQPLNPDLEARFTVLSDYTFDRSNNTLKINDEFFHKDEDWVVLFFHIDRKNYNYLDVILRAMKSLVNGAHPFYGLSMGNPPSTVKGDQCLGYFIASPVSLSPIHIGN